MEHFPNPNSAFFTLFNKLLFLWNIFSCIIENQSTAKMSFNVRNKAQFQNQILVLLVDFYGHPF